MLTGVRSAQARRLPWAGRSTPTRGLQGPGGWWHSRHPHRRERLSCLSRASLLEAQADGPLSLLDRQKTRLREASDLPWVTLGGGSLPAVPAASP